MYLFCISLIPSDFVQSCNNIYRVLAAYIPTIEKQHRTEWPSL